VTATLLTWGLALPLGVWSAERLGRLPDTVISWAMAGLLVVPDLLIALACCYSRRAVMVPDGRLASVGFESLSPLDNCVILHCT